MKVYDLNEIISLSHGSVGRAFDLISEGFPRDYRKS